MKTIHIIIGLVTLVILALLAAVVSAVAKNKRGNDPAYVPPAAGGGSGSTGSTGSSSSPKKPAPLDYDKVLGLGSKGQEVEELQRLYNASRYGTPKLVVDGDFGSKTQAAVLKVMGFGIFSTSLNSFTARLNAADSSTSAPESSGSSWSWYSFLGI